MFQLLNEHPGSFNDEGDMFPLYQDQKPLHHGRKAINDHSRLNDNGENFPFRQHPFPFGNQERIFEDHDNFEDERDMFALYEDPGNSGVGDKQKVLKDKDGETPEDSAIKKKTYPEDDNKSALEDL